MEHQQHKHENDPKHEAQQSPYQTSGYVKNAGSEEWTTGLCGCMEDPSNACITCCCPCYTFGQIAEIVDKGQTSCAMSGILYGLIELLVAVPCILSCSYRTKIRTQYGIVESTAAGCFKHCFCECCALCQEYRELKHRGLDPAIGWEGNVMKNPSLQQPPQVAMTAPVNQNMAGPNMAK